VKKKMQGESATRRRRGKREHGGRSPFEGGSQGEAKLHRSYPKRLSIQEKRWADPQNANSSGSSKGRSRHQASRPIACKLKGFKVKRPRQAAGASRKKGKLEHKVRGLCTGFQIKRPEIE